MVSTTFPVEIVWVGQGGAEVYVVGDFPDWSVRHRLVERNEGVYRTTLALAPGLYRYKLLVNGAWHVDPYARIVDIAEGPANGVIAVGAASPPIYFAPDRRHVSLDENGALLVHAEIDIAELDLGYDLHLHGGTSPKPAAAHTLPLVLRGVREDRALVFASTPNAHGATHLSFGRTQRFAMPPARSALGAPPSWLDGAVIYGVFIDRWHRGRASGPERKMLAKTTPSTPFAFYGGDLDGVRESLAYFRDLGVTAIALSPVHTSHSPHRYDAVDLTTVDEKLGGARALTALLGDAHAQGLRVIVDVSLTHVSEKHAAFQDLLANQRASKFASWFRVHRFPVVARDGATFDHYYNCADQPWLDLDDAGARAHAIGAAVRLVELGVDGLRLDAMDDAPSSFWRELRAAVRARNPDALLLGEVVGDNLWTRAEERGADCITDFRIRDALTSFFARRTLDAASFLEALVFASHRTGAFASSFRVGFVDNHDTARFLSIAKDPAALRRALATLLFLEGTVWLGYGTDAELAAHKGEGALDASWPERMAMPALDVVQRTETYALLKRVCALRRAFDGPLTIERAHGTRLTLRRGKARLEVDRDAGEPVVTVD